MAKRKTAGKGPSKPRYSKEDHQRFIQDLKANDEARHVLAAWLTERGWIVEPLAPMSVAATPEEWNKHSDSGDVWASKQGAGMQSAGPRTRFEVKQRSINFTSAADFPFPDCVICRCSGFDRAIVKPAFVILFNLARDHAAVIDASKWQTWGKVKKTDTRHDDLTQEFYVCDLKDVSFQTIPYHLTRAAERAKAREEADRGRCKLFHADPKNWQRATVEGRVQVTCKGCGGFIGWVGD